MTLAEVNNNASTEATAEEALPAEAGYMEALKELQEAVELLRHRVYMLENKERMSKSFGMNKKNGQYQERKQA